MAETEIAAGRYTEALRHIPLANSRKMQVDKNFQNAINRIQYKAWLGMGDKDKALAFLEKYMDGYKELAREKEKKEYNRAAAEMGLQFETERNAALAKRNELQSEQIDLLKKFRLVSFITLSLSLIVLAVLFVVRRQALEIKASRQKMKEVLDNIDEGILILDDQLKVLQGYSPYLDQIFSSVGTSLVGVRIQDLFFPDGTTGAKVMMNAALEACVGQDPISWDLIAPICRRRFALASVPCTCIGRP